MLIFHRHFNRRNSNRSQNNYLYVRKFSQRFYNEHTFFSSMQFSQRILVCRCFAKSTLDSNFSSLNRSRLNFTELMCMERNAEIREKVTPFMVLEKPTFTILTAKGPKPAVVPISAVLGNQKIHKIQVQNA